MARNDNGFDVSTEKNKVYGDNRPFFRGRLISGCKACAITFLLVFAPSVVWHIEVGAFWGYREATTPVL